MKKRTRSIYHPLLAATLLVSGTLPLAAPVFAEGTAGGTSISNTANATYEDPNNPNTPINTTSNPVVVTVAEVAGITISASGVTDVNGGTVAVGDQLQYTYTVTNVGNDPTRFRIPNLANVTGPATVTGNLEYSTDGGTTWTAITTSEVITNSVPVDGSILVRVPVTVAAGAQPNDIITVTLGDTPGDAQNQLRNPNGGDVYTVDNPDGAPGEVAGIPANGVREASITQRATVASTVKTLALATLLKTRTNHDTAGTTNSILDDKLTYGLSLRVENTDPTGNGITPTPLVGTSINLNGSSATRILISDAIPSGTELAAAPTPPAGWQAVYTTDAVTTDANAANWKLFPLQGGDTLAGVTRVGFVNNPASLTSVPQGTTVSGFSIELAVRSTATSPLTVANIAQVFGQTPGTNVSIFDESGDQNPSNYDGSTPPVGTDTNNDGVPDVTTLPPATVGDGFIDTPTNPETGIDPGNNNTGTGPEGEANTFTLSVPVPALVLNGPANAPDAIGPTNNNDDFTNSSSLVPPNQAPGSTLNPSPVAFTNTVRNSGTSAGTVTLVPTPPTNAGDLPADTTVTITYGSDSVAYTYNGTTFTITSSTTGGNPISIPALAPNQTINYGVEVNLPTGTPLSTDIDRGFPVPITASIDTNNDNTPDAQNITIDRVYTGYLKMVKESRVLVGTGPAVQGTDGTFSAAPKRPAPGNIIEYRITYRNISEPQAGPGNVILNASRIVVTEDGTTAASGGTNNWALDNDTNGIIDTSNVVGSAIDSGGSTLTFFSGNPATTPAADQTGTTLNTDVTKYINTVTGIVSPGQVRTFTFQRKVN
jgi:hypothetical protein